MKSDARVLALCVLTSLAPVVVVADDAAITPRIAVITRAVKPLGLDEANTMRTYWTPEGKPVNDPAAIVPQLERLQRGFPSSDELRLFVYCDNFTVNTSGHIEFRDTQGAELQGLSIHSHPIMTRYANPQRGTTGWHVYLLSIPRGGKLPARVSGKNQGKAYVGFSVPGEGERFHELVTSLDFSAELVAKTSRLRHASVAQMSLPLPGA